MRLVTDTNIAVSGLLWGGLPGRLIDAAQDLTIELVTSPALLTELRTVFSRRKFSIQMAKRGVDAMELVARYGSLATVVYPGPIEPVITRDPTDDQVLAAAFAGRADLSVSGDAHLLDLVSWRGIPIVKAKEALDRIVQVQAQRLA